MNSGQRTYIMVSMSKYIQVSRFKRHTEITNNNKEQTSTEKNIPQRISCRYHIGTNTKRGLNNPKVKINLEA